MTKSPYKVTKIDPHTWIIEEKSVVSQCLVYLLEGRDAAILIDTGLALGDIKALTDSLTDKPVSVVCTHGHFDHVCGNFRYENIFLHKDDQATFELYSSKEYLEKLSQDMIPGIVRFVLREKIDSVLSLKKGGNYHYFEDGHIFDLGGRQVEVVHTPGHSPGSVCLLDRDARQLFTGDTICDWGILINLELSCAPEVYLQSVKRLKNYADGFDLLYSGHHRVPIDKKYLDEYIACAQGIVDGSIKTSRSGLGRKARIEAKYGRIFIAVP